MLKRDELWPGGPHYYYDTELFAPTTDSFALGWFARPKRGSRVCDLGCGTGLLGALLLARDGTVRLCGVERNEEAAALARRTFSENGWDAEVLTLDLRGALPGAGTTDYVISNPPYFPSGSGVSAADAQRRSAREETDCTLGELCAAAARLLRYGGSFALVHRTERLTDLLCTLRAHTLEPKRLRFVVKRADAAPSLVLIEARRGGRPGLTVEAPLVIGSAEWDRVYFRADAAHEP